MPEDREPPPPPPPKWRRSLPKDEREQRVNDLVSRGMDRADAGMAVAMSTGALPYGDIVVTDAEGNIVRDPGMDAADRRSHEELLRTWGDETGVYLTVEEHKQLRDAIVRRRKVPIELRERGKRLWAEEWEMVSDLFED